MARSEILAIAVIAILMTVSFQQGMWNWDIFLFNRLLINFYDNRKKMSLECKLERSKSVEILRRRKNEIKNATEILEIELRNKINVVRCCVWFWFYFKLMVVHFWIWNSRKNSNHECGTCSIFVLVGGSSHSNKKTEKCISFVCVLSSSYSNYRRLRSVCGKY